MKIKLEGQYKSLSSFESDLLPDLTIITGRNGSGKSQLIELFRLIQVGNKSVNIEIDPIPKRIQIEGLSVERLGDFNYTNWKTRVDQLLKGLKANGKGYLAMMDYLISIDFEFEKLRDGNLYQIMHSRGREGIEMLEKAYKLGNLNGPGRPLDLAAFANSVQQNLFEEGIYAHDLLKYASEKLRKDVAEITENDLYSMQIPEKFIDSVDLFDSHLGGIFYSYAKRKGINDYEYYEKIADGVSNGSIPKEEFAANFPAPWKIINEILDKFGLKYRFEEVQVKPHMVDVLFKFPLKNIETGMIVDAANLSSGEKIIIGLVIKLFNSEYYQADLRFPDLLVLDEPDGHLHPEMSKMLIDILDATFVRELKIKVIFTTHSPSTIAVGPEESIFEMQNFPITRISKVSKDDALKILTANVPTLSIDYKNHRQIFVESPTDQYYYQAVFGKMRADNKTFFNLYFISLAAGKGNSNQVLTLTKDIVKSGSRTAFGIVDWDLTRTAEDRILIHGFQSRYSIENFVLDPVYLAILFLEDGGANGIKKIGFDNTYNEYSLVNEPTGRLQEVVDWIFDQIRSRFSALDYITRVELSYANGRKIKVPLWYVRTKGHDVEVKLREVFPSLAKFRNEGELQRRLTEIIAKCYPAIPQETFDTLEALSTQPHS